MNVIIYGMGRLFEKYFIKNNGCLDFFLEDGINVVGIADGNRSMEGNEVKLKCGTFRILRNDLLKNIDFDYIFVTSRRNYDSIVKDLIEMEIDIHNIGLLDDYISEKLLQTERISGKSGIEIGGPSVVFDKIYKNCDSCDDVDFCADTVWGKREIGSYFYKGNAIGTVYISDATDLNIIKSESYDFVLSSNNIEHIANPIKALMEFKRILKNDGILYIVVPYKEDCFDHNREYTSFEHIIQDYDDDVDEHDLTHLVEIIEKHDYEMDKGCGTEADFIKRSKENFKNRCLHHHVFSIEVLERIAEYLEMSIIKVERFENNLYLIAQK